MMKKSTKVSIVRLLNVVAVAIPFALVWFGYYANHTFNYIGYRTRFIVMVLYFISYIFMIKTYDALLISYSRVRDMFINQVLSILLTDTVMFVILWILSYHFPNILPALACLFLQIIVACLWCVVSHRWYFAHFKAQKTLVLYDVREGLEKLIDEYGLEKKFEVVEVNQINEVLDDPDVLNGIETVFFSGIHSHERNIILKKCVEKGVTAFVIPRLGDSIMSGASKQHLFHLPMLRVNRYSPGLLYRMLKRAFDIVISGVMLLLLSPLMLVLALLIRKDGGPAFYKQTRLTKDGKLFKVIKFRSMRVDAEKDGVARLSTGENDDRITKVGHFIRACRMDELPQLLNIFKGDMSIVGPRPERPEIAAEYEKEMPEFKLRLQCRAGLTGYAQVYGKYNTTPYDKLNMDLIYIGNYSLANDLRIVLATIGILFKSDSTEGIEAGATNAMK